MHRAADRRQLQARGLVARQQAEADEMIEVVAVEQLVDGLPDASAKVARWIRPRCRGSAAAGRDRANAAAGGAGLDLVVRPRARRNKRPREARPSAARAHTLLSWQ